MEEEGYFWFFDHSASAHTLIIADANTAFVDADQATMRVVSNGEESDVLGQFARASVTAFGQVKLADYDPLNPSTPVEGEQQTILATAGKATRDIYRFPALTTVADTASKRARLRQEAAEASATLFEGSGRNPSLIPGRKFTISKDRLNGGSDTTYVVRHMVHAASGDAEAAGSAVDSYSNTLEAFPAATPWRDWPQDRRPAMAGIHTAIVVGSSGEEIHTDQYGRVKVRFFWDHRQDATADTTIFIRVMQPWSGNTWGWQHLPRVGTEVAVAFVNGDPDSPIVVGCLYNAEQMQPFGLPDQQTKSGLRTRSTTSGGTSDFSEWSIDDKKGSELVFLHAQKDLTEEVENDHSVHIMHDHTLKIDNARILKVGKTEDITIGDAQTIKVGNGRTTTISAADEQLTVSSGNITNTASAGDIKIAASAGNISISAAQSIELKVGSTSVKLDPSGVTVTGMTVSIKGTMQLDLEGLMSTLKGNAMLTLKGAIAMIN
jgi:type VI secretion system secreted protein VgrG